MLCTHDPPPAQTWHAPTSSYILTPKSFGKSLKPADLPSGMVRFFPIPSDVLLSLAPPSSPTSSESISTPSITTGDVSHLPLTPAEPAHLDKLTSPYVPTHPTSLAPPTPTSAGPLEYTSHAIPPELLSRLLGAIDERLGELENVVSTLEARFIGASVLIVYEGDPERLADALERYDATKQARVSAGTNAGTVEAGPEDVDEDEDDEDEDLLGDSDLDSSTSSDDDSQDGTRADARRARRCPPFTLKMIDFAHTRLVQGEGVDEGVLLGLRTLRRLVKARREEVARAEA